ncbi:MAG: hypothetical protein CSA81_12970 [Acidobacteria bacterium]|nr:MAG: hypothetical protein CSA81_12970 [Acidobacteriota bacterium]PIE89131.1 MAG: hypothetical protein CR997_12710 [Acidobacteriota bacterium]
MSDQIGIIDKLVSKYDKTPAIKILLQFIPIGSAFNTWLQHQANKIKSDRLKVFFEELASGKQTLSEEVIKQEDFLHAFFCTTNAAINTRRKEKIKLFAKLLNNSFNPELHVKNDEYEELLSILDGLSLREFKVLHQLKLYEDLHPIQDGQDTLKNAEKYWDLFKNSATNEFDIPKESFNAFMSRTERSGLYLRITGYFDNTKNMGRTTPLLDRLIKLIELSK